MVKKLVKRQERDTPTNVIPMTPPSNTPKSEVEILREQIEQLQKENEALKSAAKGEDVPATVLGGKEYKIFIKTNFYTTMGVAISNDARIKRKDKQYVLALYTTFVEQLAARKDRTAPISISVLMEKSGLSRQKVLSTYPILEGLKYISVVKGKDTKKYDATNTYTLKNVTEFPVAEHSVFFNSAKKFIERHSDEIDKLGTNELHFRRWAGTKFTDPDVVLDPEYHNVEGITGNKHQKADINEITGEFKANNTKKKRGKEDKKGGLRASSNGCPRKGEYNQDQDLSFSSDFEDKHFRDKYFNGSSWVFNVEGKRPYQVERGIGDTTHKEVFAEAMASYIENGEISKVVKGDTAMVKLALEYMGYDKNNIRTESFVIIKDM